jgi:hypothetical protein
MDWRVSNAIRAVPQLHCEHNAGTPMIAVRTTAAPALTSRVYKRMKTALNPPARKRGGAPIPTDLGPSKRRNITTSKEGTQLSTKDCFLS